jgi:hypothetical protein
MGRILRAEGFTKVYFVLKLLIASSCVLVLTIFLPPPIFPQDESKSLSDVNRQTYGNLECCVRFGVSCKIIYQGEGQCPNESGYRCPLIIKRCVCGLFCAHNCDQPPPFDFCRPNCNDAPFTRCIIGCNRIETTVKWEEWYVFWNPNYPTYCNPMQCFCEDDDCQTNPAMKALECHSCEEVYYPPIIW